MTMASMRSPYSGCVADLHVLRVFCGDDGGGGNLLGVFRDGGAVAPGVRQAVARELGFSETVFVDDAGAGRIAIYTPEAELDFAGHPAVGTAWLLRAPLLRPPAGEVPARAEDELAFVAARPEWGPAFELEQLGSAEEVDALDGPPGGRGAVDAWAWIDEERALVRSRVFVDLIGIPEDEATGSAATKLAAQVGREIDIRQGRGSRILARPLGDGMVEIGGRVELDEVRDYALPAGTTST
jgi:predicted PhzF superfamily epimerase YddE/YHI9